MIGMLDIESQLIFDDAQKVKIIQAMLKLFSNTQFYQKQRYVVYWIFGEYEDFSFDFFKEKKPHIVSLVN